jgi:lipoprotein NlpD
MLRQQRNGQWRFTRSQSAFLLTAFIVGVGGCSSIPWKSPWAEAGSVSHTAVPAGYYRVNPSDSVLSIATAFGRQEQELVNWNALANGDAIVPGQLLRVAPPVGPAIPGSAAARATSQDAPQTLVTPAHAKFIWPARGRVAKAFIAGKTRGLLIAGTPGEPVRAAAEGRVVYVGTGISGYGPLIIIKHNDGLITAYGHNGRLLVKDSEVVSQGQVIADMGVDAGGNGQLQFEIRENGRQVDPSALLPTQSR